MCTWLDSLDGQPGTLPETRILNDATVLVVLEVSWGAGPDTRGRLVLRFDQRGHMYAAIQQHESVADASEEPLR